MFNLVRGSASFLRFPCFADYITLPIQARTAALHIRKFFSAIILLTRETRVEYRASSSNGEPPCRIEVNAMPKKGKRKAHKKQRQGVLAWMAHLAAATYWVLRIIFLLYDRFCQ